MKMFVLIGISYLFYCNCFGQTDVDISHDIYHRYQGDFVFDDGTYITGGPMGEVAGSLVYIEPENGSIGGVFVPETKTIFNSIFPANSKSKIEFKLNNDGGVAGLWFKNGNKKRKYAYKKITPVIQYVTFRNKDITLVGELTLPQGKGPFPAIINVHGSGRQDRHLGPWVSFFTGLGIAVLSYDKRGVGASTGKFETAGYHDLADDLVAGISFLRRHPAIESSKIGIHGSSEGGWVGSIAAAKANGISFLIIRAGPGTSGWETYMYEVKNELAARGLSKEQWVEAVGIERAYYDLALSDVSLDSVNRFIQNAREKYEWFVKAFDEWSYLDPEYRVKMRKNGPIDPVESLRRIKVPVLWFLAEEDENVPYELSKVRIRSALEEAGNEDYEIVTLHGVKHDFILHNQDGSFKYVDGYWNRMAKWLRKHNY